MPECKTCKGSGTVDGKSLCQICDGWGRVSESSVVFVFGSNLAGRHGKGAALYARQNYGAVYGVGVGHTGQAYAIPTKDEKLRTLPLGKINEHVQVFLAYARDNPTVAFEVTAIGTGLAGYRHEQIAPLFTDAPVNCWLPKEWA